MKYFFSLLLLCLPGFAPAQETPIASEQEIGSRLFRLQEPVNYSFTIALPEHGFMIVEFPKFNDWQDGGAFRTVVQEAAKVSEQLKDSLKIPTAAYRLDMHLPISNTPVTARISEQAGSTNFVLLNDRDQAPLKIGMDTVRVLKTLRQEKETTRKVQVQYTFILKEMAQIQTLAADESWMTETSSFVDSVMSVYRSEWSNPGAWYHQLFVQYRPEETELSKRLVINKKENENAQAGIFRMIYYDIGFGMSLVRNTIAPATEIGLTVILDKERESTFFTRFSANSMGLFEKKPDGNFKAYGSTFVNFEIGTTTEGTTYALPLYTASLGFGVKIGSKNDHPSFQRDWYKLFFRYNITKTLSFRPEFYITPKRDDEGIVGITVSLRII